LLHLLVDLFELVLYVLENHVIDQQFQCAHGGLYPLYVLIMHTEIRIKVEAIFISTVQYSSEFVFHVMFTCYNTYCRKWKEDDKAVLKRTED
jgi:hypothetical protein